MTSAVYRPATLSDVDQLAVIRAAEWGTEAYWRYRIRGYLTGDLSPRFAQPSRTVLCALLEERVVGFAAGHLSQRLSCTGEVEWMNVRADRRGLGIAAALLGHLAAWFVSHRSTRACVDPDPPSRGFYLRLGAQPLDDHWLVWPDIGVLASGAPASQNQSPPS